MKFFITVCVPSGAHIQHVVRAPDEVTAVERVWKAYGGVKLHIISMVRRKR